MPVVAPGELYARPWSRLRRADSYLEVEEPVVVLRGGEWLLYDDGRVYRLRWRPVRRLDMPGAWMRCARVEKGWVCLRDGLVTFSWIPGPSRRAVARRA